MLKGLLTLLKTNKKLDDAMEVFLFQNDSNEEVTVIIEPTCEMYKVPPKQELRIEEAGIPSGKRQLAIMSLDCATRVSIWAGGGQVQAKMDGEVLVADYES